MLCGQHLKNIVLEFVKNKKLLDSDGASQILFYLNTYLIERWGKLGGSFPILSIKSSIHPVWRLCIEKKKTQFERINEMTIKSDIH